MHQLINIHNNSLSNIFIFLFDVFGIYFQLSVAKTREKFIKLFARSIQLRVALVRLVYP